MLVRYLERPRLPRNCLVSRLSFYIVFPATYSRPVTFLYFTNSSRAPSVFKSSCVGPIISCLPPPPSPLLHSHFAIATATFLPRFPLPSVHPFVHHLHQSFGVRVCFWSYNFWDRSMTRRTRVMPASSIEQPPMAARYILFRRFPGQSKRERGRAANYFPPISGSSVSIGSDKNRKKAAETAWQRKSHR